MKRLSVLLAVGVIDKYESMMVSVGLNEQEAKSILEYLRQEDAKTNL